MDIAVLVGGGVVDTLLAAPVVRSLGEAGGHRVTVACAPRGAELAGSLTGAAAVLPLDALGSGPAAGLTTVAAVAALRGVRLDAALLCSTRRREALIAYTAGIARRVGVAGGPLLSTRVRTAAAEHRAVTWLRLASAAGLGADPVDRGALEPGAAARARARESLLGGGLEDGRLLVALVPGVAWGDPEVGAEIWPAERYAYLANLLARRHGAGVVLLGDERDRERIDEILLDLDAAHCDLCGELGPHEAAAVIQRCDLVVGGESPMLHLAPTVGTPAVALYGGHDGRLVGPFGPDHRVVQAVARGDRSAATASLAQIRVDDVLAAIEAAL